jgi:hypothetical protein
VKKIPPLRAIRVRTFPLTVAILFVCGIGLGQSSEKPKVPPAKSYSLRISKQAPYIVTLKAQDTPLPEIASNLAVRLKVQVVVGQSQRARKITTEFKQLMFEPALQHLAPQVFIDYEVTANSTRPVAIFLNGYEDPAPPLNFVSLTNSASARMEGNTLDGLETEKELEEEIPLRVKYEKNLLTVKAKQQLLSVVLAKIASELTIPFESRNNSNDVVDLNIIQEPLEQALQQMSPLVRLYVRANLQIPERRPYRLVLMAAEKTYETDASAH